MLLVFQRFVKMNKKSPVIEILFDGDFGNTFHAGENVSGHVHVQTSERIQIRGSICVLSFMWQSLLITIDAF